MSTILRAWVLLVFVASVAQGAETRATRVRATPVKRVAAREPARSAAARTLDDIHIEGEIPVPQVLFITARSQRRFLEFQHGRYLRSAQQLGEATTVPTRVVVTTAPVSKSPVTPAQESHR